MNRIARRVTWILVPLLALCFVERGLAASRLTPSEDWSVSIAFQPFVRLLDFPLPGAARGQFEVERSQRLDLAGGEGTIEIWIRPTSKGNGGPIYRTLFVNGRSVYAPDPDDPEKFTHRFETRYAAYVTQTSILFQSGDQLHSLGLNEFEGEDVLTKRTDTHLCFATKGDSTTVYVNGRVGARLPVGYGEVTGSVLTIGGLPENAKGLVRRRKNQGAFETFDAASAEDFGPYEGRLGGFRIWDRCLPTDSLLSSANGSAPILGYGQFQAERDISPDYAHGDGDAGFDRGNLVALSRFDAAAGPVVELADILAGNWINTQLRAPLVRDTPAGLSAFEPVTLVQDYVLVYFAPVEGSGSPPSVYSAYANGELAGTLVRSGLTGIESYSFTALDGTILEVEYDPSVNSDRLSIKGGGAEFGPASAGTVYLERDDGRNKGTPADSDNVFLASMKQTDIPSSLMSYDLLLLDPFDIEAGEGRRQWVFSKGHPRNWQLAFGSNEVIPAGFYVDHHASAGAISKSVTTTNERETYEALRAKFGFSGGVPGIYQSGAEGSWQKEVTKKTSESAVTTYGTAYGKIGTLLLDPLTIELHADFVQAVERLAEDRDFDGFIGSWGTHYPRALTHGGFMRVDRSIDDKTVSDAYMMGFDLSVSLKFGSQDSGKSPGAEVSGGGGMTTRESVLERLEVKEEAWTGKGFSAIAANPDMVVGDSNKDSAVPISMDLRLLSDLLSPTYFEDPAIYVALRHELTTELLEYLAGDPPSDERNFQPPTSALTLRAKVARFRPADVDDGGGSVDIFGTIRVTAFEDLQRGRQLLLDEHQEFPTTLWDTSSGDDWKVEEGYDWVSFDTAPRVSEFYTEAKSGKKHPDLVGPADVSYGPVVVTVDSAFQDRYAIQMTFEAWEDDTITDDHFPEKTFTFPDEAFRHPESAKSSRPGEYATKDIPRKHTVKLSHDNGGGSIEFEVHLWMEGQFEPWKGPDASSFVELRRTLDANLPTGRRRGSDELVRALGVEPADVLAYFPFDYDGLRKPGARHWQPEHGWDRLDAPHQRPPNRHALVHGVDMGNLSLVFDLRPNDHALGLYFLKDAQGAGESGADLWFSHLPEEPDESGKRLGILGVGLQGGGKEQRFPDLCRIDTSHWHTVGLSFARDPLLNSGDDKGELFRYVVLDREEDRVVAEGTEALTPSNEGLVDRHFRVVDIANDGIHITNTIIGLMDDTEATTILRGTPLAFNTSTLSWVTWVHNGTNGTGTISGFAAEDIVISGGAAQENGVIMIAGEINVSDIVLDGGINETLANLKTALLASPLRENNIRITGVRPTGAQLDEFYVFGRALTASEMLAVANQPRAVAPVVVRPVAYWPFDGKRSAAPALQTAQGVSLRVRDDALALLPSGDELVADGLLMRDMSVQFDARLTQSSRRIELSDELGLVHASVFRKDELSGFEVSIGKEQPSNFLLRGYTPEPDYWQRYAFSFDGVILRLAADDGSGWVVQGETTIYPHSRDEVARALAAHDDQPIQWTVRSDYNYPGTLLAGVEGFAPQDPDQLSLIDEVRLWNGAMGADEMLRSMRRPRTVVIPDQDTRLVTYLPMRELEKPQAAEASDLLAQLVSPRDRAFHGRQMQRSDLPESKAGRWLVEEGPMADGLRVYDGLETAFRTENLNLADFTLHFDFVPGDGVLSISKGPVSFQCDQGRTLLTIETREGNTFEYDPAFGDRLATDRWHKLVVGVDARESRLRVFLDGEASREVVLDDGTVDALQAADSESNKWRMSFEAAAEGAPCVVDEILVLTPALEQFDLELLAARSRRGGEAPPRRIVRAVGRGPIDRKISNLRPEDELLVDDLIAYFPFDEDFEDRSGRKGPSMSPATEALEEPVATIDDAALRARGPVGAQVPSLDLEQFTLAFWFAPQSPGTALLAGPGFEFRLGTNALELQERIDQAVARGTVRPEDIEAILGADNPMVAIGDFLKTSGNRANFEIMQMMIPLIITSSSHFLELHVESATGVVDRQRVEFVSEDRELTFRSVNSPLDRLIAKEKDPERVIASYPEHIRRRFEAPTLETWHLAVLSFDLEAGEIRGHIDGSRIKPVVLPKNFELRSSRGSAPRFVGIPDSAGSNLDVRIDELIILDGAPLTSSSIWRHLASRARKAGETVDWEVE